MMLYIRSFLFNAAFFPWTFIVVFSATPGLLLGAWYIRLWADLWGRGVNKLLKMVGVTVEIRGLEHVPHEPVIFASKHQSAWETTMVETLFRNSIVILKKELMYVPFLGWLLWRIGSISINRKKGRKVLPQMIAGAQAAVARGSSILIFPEGTRTKPGTCVPYKQGVSALYQGTGVKVIPAAHNAGSFWPRRGFLKKPGRLIFEFLPPIEPGLTGEVFMAKLQSTIEGACERISQEATIPQNGTKKGRRRSLLKNPLSLLALTFLGAATGYVLLWLSAAQKLEDFIKTYAEELRKSEIEVTYDSFKVTGFPFRILAKVKNPAVVVPYLGKTEWQVDGKLEIFSGVWHPKTLSFDVRGKTSLTYQAHKKARPYKVTLEDLGGTFIYGPEGVEMLTGLDLKGLKMEGKSSDVQVETLKLLVQETSSEAVPSTKAIALDVEGLDLGLQTKSPLDTKIEKIRLAGLLQGTFPLDSLRESFVHWAQEGGAIEMAKISMTWGATKFKGEGAFVLDKTLQPMITFAGEMEGFDALLAGCVKAGLMKPQAAQMGQAILSPVKGTPKESKIDRVSLSLQNGELSLGPVVIAHVPAIKW